MRSWLLLAFAVAGFSGCKPKPGQLDGGSTLDAGFDAGVVRDAGSDCPTGQTRCPRGCVNLRSEWLDCGACGNICASDELCSNGTCRPSCAQPGEVYCGGTTCAHPQTDTAHCGRCGNACSPIETCDAGNCTAVPGLELCNGAVTNTSDSEEHCGGCNQPCSSTQTCLTGLCCEANQLHCGALCVDSRNDRANCGGCNRMCGSSQVCTNGSCLNCLAGQQVCNEACTATRTDPLNCGACGNQCGSSQTCVNSACTCPAVLTGCGTDCVDRFSNTAHCGACGNACALGESCIAGSCVAACPPGLTLCAGQCLDTATSNGSCGGCNVPCGTNQECVGGACVACAPGPNADCDHDGYTVAEGDCCDTPGTCSLQPERVNPGAFEVLNNFTDDNCNGLLDSADALEVDACDSMLASNSLSAIDAAKAIDICRTITPDAGVRTWGLISADWRLVNGQPLSFANAKSIRPGFGSTWVPQRGSRLLVVSSGMAADSTQTNPGPNVGPTAQQSQIHGSVANILQPCDGGCVRDWFIAANPPVKSANQLPSSPVCGAGAVFDPHLANDSVMLVLRLRVPTNARAFSLLASFFSVEYPEFVCTEFNDQLVVLVGTPSPTWPQPNPPDMNLATYREGPLRFPVGINVAAGAGIFEACEPVGTNVSCDDSFVSTRSCAAGLGPLAGTGFEQPFAGDCAQGAATRWLQVRGNVKPGEELTLRLALWDVGDDQLDSTALLDAFRWELNPVTPGTE